MTPVYLKLPHDQLLDVLEALRAQLKTNPDLRAPLEALKSQAMKTIGASK